MAADVGVPHPAPSLPNSFVGTDSRANVGEPGNLGVDVGTPHTGTLPNSFVGNDARAGVGLPNNLGGAIGIPH
jgi:hypothetical protein